MTQLRLCLNAASFPLLAFSLYISFVCYTGIIAARLKGKYDSGIPILAGVSGFLGSLLSPYPSFVRLWWLPLLMDWLTVAVATTLVYRAGERFRKRSSQHAGVNRTVSIRE